MTIDEVIADGPRRTRSFGSSACGRYQFMTATLKGLVDQGRARGSDRMTPDVQDDMGLTLLARRGWTAFMAGSISQTEFGNRLAMEWASFPVLSPVNGKRRGQSYYAGDGQNHALVSPESVERVLGSLRASPAPISSVRTPTVPAATVGASWLSRWFAPSSPSAKARPGLHSSGSADLWDVQAALKERGYYNSGLLDGLDGSKTQSAVAQIRKDNGLGDGGIDAQFLAGLPSWPHARVSAERANISVVAAAQHAPELFKPPAWLVTAGTGLLGLGGASGSGLMDQVQGGVAKFNDVSGQVQSAFAVAASVVGFVVEHKTWFFVLAGFLVLWKGVSALLRAWILVKQARA